MVTVDCIIVSNAHNAATYKLTADTLHTLFLCEAGNTGIELNVVVVEQTATVWQGCTTIQYNRSFNYNACLNMAMRHTRGTWAFWLNNDVLISPGAISALIRHATPVFGSWGCYCPKTHGKGRAIAENGYEIGLQLTGWALFVSRKVWQRIGGLVEDVEFWYSDNAYGEQLKRHGIPHMFCREAVVKHLGSATTRQIPMGKAQKLTHGQKNAFKAWERQTR